MRDIEYLMALCKSDHPLTEYDKVTIKRVCEAYVELYAKVMAREIVDQMFKK